MQKTKNGGDVTSPIDVSFYGLSGQKYYIQVGILYANGEFCSMCVVPWSMTTKMTLLGLY